MKVVPMTMLAPGILVYEKRPRWEAELKRSLAGEGWQIRGCRTTGSVLSLLTTMPHGVLVADFAAGPAECLHLLEQVLQRRLPATAIVISPAIDADLEWPARELGALDVLRETEASRTLARLCRRQLSRGVSVSAAGSAVPGSGVCGLPGNGKIS
jgi:DNA-binding NtrC family response regulator